MLRACYLDDILITTRSAEEHKKVLSGVLQRLERQYIKAKLGKCEFCKSAVNSASLLSITLGTRKTKKDCIQLKRKFGLSLMPLFQQILKT